MKPLNMSFKERFLFLKRKRYHETRLRVIQAHHKHLYGLAYAVDLCQRFPPIHLRVLPDIKLQWQIRRTMFSRAPLLADVAVQITFTPAIPFRLQELIDLVTRIPLLPRQLLAFLEQFPRSAPDTAQSPARCVVLSADTLPALRAPALCGSPYGCVPIVC